MASGTKAFVVAALMCVVALCGNLAHATNTTDTANAVFIPDN